MEINDNTWSKASLGLNLVLEFLDSVTWFYRSFNHLDDDEMFRTFLNENTYSSRKRLDKDSELGHWR